MGGNVTTIRALITGEGADTNQQAGSPTHLGNVATVGTLITGKGADTHQQADKVKGSKKGGEFVRVGSCFVLFAFCFVLMYIANWLRGHLAGQHAAAQPVPA